LVSQVLPTAPAIAHTAIRAATLLDTSGTSRGEEVPASSLTLLQEGATEQAAIEGSPAIRSEEVTEKESANPAGQVPAQGLLVQGEAVAGPLNASAMRVRAGNRERSAWGNFPEKEAGPARESPPALLPSSANTPGQRTTVAFRRLTPPLHNLVAL